MKLSQLYSDNLKFKNIDFKPGVNIIYAKTSGLDNSDSHNLGKSTLLYLIDFMLLKELSNTTYFFNKKKILEEYTLFLEVLLNDGSYLTIKRSFKTPTRVNIKMHDYKMNLTLCNEWDYADLVISTTSKDKIDAVSIINKYLNFNIVSNYTYRSLVGYFIRSQADYDDVFQLKKFIRSDDDAWKPFVFEILGFNPDLLIRKYHLASQIEDMKTKIKALKSYNDTSAVDRLNGQIDILEREKVLIEQDLDSFNFYLTENHINKELVNEIESKVSEKYNQQYSLETDIVLIEESLKTSEIEDINSIKELFNEVSIYFPEQLSKSFDELVEFNKSLLKDRKLHLNQLLATKRVNLSKINNELRELSYRRSEILETLQNKDVIVKYKRLRHVLIEKEKSIQNLETQKEVILDTLKSVRELSALKEELTKINNLLEELIANGNDRINDIRYIFRNIFYKITSKEAIINISTNNNSNVEFKAGILGKNDKLTYEDEGFSYKKLLCICFDLALLAFYANDSFFKFVYHDGAFESLHENRKDDYVDFAFEYSDKYNIQYIISMIDTDISENKRELIEKEIVLPLYSSKDGSGTIFGIKY